MGAGKLEGVGFWGGWGEGSIEKTGKSLVMFVILVGRFYLSAENRNFPRNCVGYHTYDCLYIILYERV
jgi:hypothetical protein